VNLDQLRLRVTERMLYLACGLMVLIISLLIATILINRSNYDHRTQQLKGQLTEYQASLKAATNTIENDFNCFGTFFSKPDRQNLVLTDIHSCSIADSKTGQTSALVIASPSKQIAPLQAAPSQPTSPATSSGSVPNTNSGTSQPAPILCLRTSASPLLSGCTGL
jgi:hypothetical protein